MVLYIEWPLGFKGLRNLWFPIIWSVFSLVGELTRICKYISRSFRLLTNSDKLKILHAPLYIYSLISGRIIFKFLSSQTATNLAVSILSVLLIQHGSPQCFVTRNCPFRLEWRCYQGGHSVNYKLSVSVVRGRWWTWFSTLVYRGVWPKAASSLVDSGFAPVGEWCFDFLLFHW